ncbi:MAG: site-2 protease family protein [Desulfovibrionales bacterium]
MFEKRVTLFSLFGFDIRIDISWIIIAVLVTWSLAQGFFPYYIEGLSTSAYWIMGIVGAIGLFASILFHELWHSIIARHYGLPIGGITLFIFGGLSEMTEEPKTPKVEFLMAIAGPFSSLVLAAVMYGIFLAGGALHWPESVTSIFIYLALINTVFAVFNMLPAFPLDGGRVLRSALWKYKGNIQWATKIASQFGSFFGILLILLGILNLFTGNPIGGMWYIIIGLFLRGAAQMSYRQLLVKQNLEGETVGSLMRKSPVTVPPDISLRQLVEDYAYRHHYKLYPVTEDEKLLGCVQTKQLKEIPRDEWDRRHVRELASSCSPENTIDPREDATRALSVMNSSKNSRLMVVEDNALVGVIALKDIMGYLTTRMDLGEDEISNLRQD